MNIALKEANETHYWLRLLHRTDYIDDKQFTSMETDIKELIAILTAICKTSEEN
ncbi:MAG: four helix bundle protein [Clostridia bacterium]|nr:four helix bundle protein [Clostridia bacterium]